MRLKYLGLVGLLIGAPVAAQTVPCGGSFGDFMQGVKAEAESRGLPARGIKAVMAAARPNASVLKRDRSQGVFRQSFLEFSARAVSQNRLDRAVQVAGKYPKTFAKAARDYGVPPEVILAFWAMETDFGAFMGDFPTISALATLAHDCRRPHLFRPQLFAAMELIGRGDMDPAVTGAWAGEIGHVQMLPGDILERGVDGDGDGRVSLKSSAPDAILSAANMLRYHGWRPGEPWLVEVTAPDTLDWGATGFDAERPVSDWARAGVAARSGALPNGRLGAVLLVPQGRKGPKFLAFHNFTHVYLEWNKSLVNTTTAAYLATRIGGAQRYLKGNPDPAFSDDEMILLQKRLKARGHDVGKVDAILGRLTRAAVRAEQKRLGLPADGWPTAQLLNALR